MPKVTPFLWLESGALDAARFYVSLFPNPCTRRPNGP